MTERDIQNDIQRDPISRPHGRSDLFHYEPDHSEAIKRSSAWLRNSD